MANCCAFAGKLELRSALWISSVEADRETACELAIRLRRVEAFAARPELHREERLPLRAAQDRKRQDLRDREVDRVEVVPQVRFSPRQRLRDGAVADAYDRVRRRDAHR